MSKVINVTVEGSLLPPVEDINRGYANVSTRYLRIWLELLVNEHFDTDSRPTRADVNDSQVHPRR